MFSPRVALILKPIEERKQHAGRHLLAETHDTAAAVVNFLHARFPDAVLDAVCSLRRGCESCGDLDILASGADPSIMEAFALDLSEVTRVVGEHSYDHRNRGQAIDAIVADAVLREQVVAASSAMRANVQRYFERALDLSHGPLVLCDIGWGGKIQACIDAIVRGDS